MLEGLLILVLLIVALCSNPIFLAVLTSFVVWRICVTKKERQLSTSPNTEEIQNFKSVKKITNLIFALTFIAAFILSYVFRGLCPLRIVLM